MKSPLAWTIGAANAMEHSFCAIYINAVAVYDRAAARAIVEAVLVVVIRWVFKVPKEFSGFASQTT